MFSIQEAIPSSWNENHLPKPRLLKDESSHLEDFLALSLKVRAFEEISVCEKEKKKCLACSPSNFREGCNKITLSWVKVGALLFLVFNSFLKGRWFLGVPPKDSKAWLEQNNPKGYISPSLGICSFPSGAVGVYYGFGFAEVAVKAKVSPSSLASAPCSSLLQDCCPWSKCQIDQRGGKHLTVSAEVLLIPICRLKSFPYCFRYLPPENSSLLSGSSAGSGQQRLT